MHKEFMFLVAASYQFVWECLRSYFMAITILLSPFQRGFASVR